MSTVSLVQHTEISMDDFACLYCKCLKPANDFSHQLLGAGEFSAPSQCWLGLGSLTLSRFRFLPGGWHTFDFQQGICFYRMGQRGPRIPHSQLSLDKLWQ